MTDTPTPRTDALTFEIEARRKLRGFNMPEDLADALNLSDTIERDLTACRAALRKMLDLFDGKLRCADHETDRECLNRITAETLSAARAILPSTGEGEGK